MRGDGSEAAAADERDAAALGLDPAPRLRVVRVGHERLLACPHLQRERTLSSLREHHLGIEAMPDLGLEPEPLEPAGGEDDRVEPALASLPEPGVDVAPERLDREGRVEREQLRAAADRRRADPHPGPDPVGAAESVPRVLAGRVGADREPFGVRRGHVLGGMDGDVDPPREQRLLELLDEDAALADLPERLRPVAVARGRDRDERDLHPWPAQRLGGAFGLGEREPTAAGADADEHSGDALPWRPGTAGTRRSRATPTAGSGRRRSAPGGAAGDSRDTWCSRLPPILA